MHENRQILYSMLVKRNIPVETPTASLDLIVRPMRPRSRAI